MLDKWSAFLERLGVQDDSRMTYELFSFAYSEPWRAYHTAQHIEECLDLFSLAKPLCVKPDAVEMAIWWHDAVYEPHKHDNEERSAVLAARICKRLGLSDCFKDDVSDLILVTKRHNPKTLDEQVLVDIDLSILGADPARFVEYDAQIREEYKDMSLEVYCAKRKKVLAGFLDRTPLFSTPLFHERFDRAARENLREAIARL